MMGDRYRRTVSFPHPNPDRPSKPSAAKSLHVRSCSLPCVRSQPLIPQLRDEVNELRSWSNSRPDLIPGSALAHSNNSWLVNGLTRLKNVLDSLDDVLQMPQTHDALSPRSDLVEKLLENFLQFVDVFGIFQSSVLALKQELIGAHVAVRRNDHSKLALHVKSQKKIAKELSKLISTVRSIQCPTITSINGHDEIPCLIRDVHELTGVVSASVFDGVMRSLGSAHRRTRSTSWGGFGFCKMGHRDVEGDVESMWGLMRKSAVEEKKPAAVLVKKMKELDECVSGMEDGCERVFRSLICTRVSLLNILTHI